MCKDCRGRCRNCQKRLHNNYTMLILTGGMWAVVAAMFGWMVPRKHSGPCSMQ